MTNWFRLATLWMRRHRGKAVGALETLDTGRWVLVTVVLGLATPFVPWKLPNFLNLSSYSSVWILAGFMGISVTLLALLYAILTFRGQQLATRLPAELVGDLFEPRWHRAAFWRLLTIFAVTVVALGPIDQARLPGAVMNAMVGNLLLLVLVVTGVQRGIGRVFDKRYSQAVVRVVLRHITDTHLLSQHSRRTGFPASLASGVTTDVADPFALIEQVCVRAMKEGDLTTAHLVLRAVASHTFEFVKRETASAPGRLRSRNGLSGISVMTM